MSKTIRQLKAEELRQFNPTQYLDEILDKARWEKAYGRLPQLLTVLREQFGATRVVVFGSLADKDRYTRWSDIDLAAWGIPPERFYEAIDTLNDLSKDIKVDLVDPQRCSSTLLKNNIEEKGIEV